MALHLSVITDRYGEPYHILNGDSLLRGKNNVSQLLDPDVSGLLTRARNEGAVFAQPFRFKDGSDVLVSALSNRNGILLIVADESHELTATYKSLKEPNLDLNGELDFGIYDEITRLNNELINAQRHLAKMNSRYSRDIERLGKTLTAIGSGIIVVDGSGSVDFMNQAAIEMLGAKVSLTGSPLDEVYRIEEARDTSSIGGTEDPTGIRRRLRTFHGADIYVIDSVNPIGDEGKVIAFQDISQIENLKDDLWRSNELLRLMTKVMRHDLLNHLTIINGYIEIEDPSYENKNLSRAMVSVEKAEAIIRQMKEMEKMVLRQGELEPYALGDVINATMEGSELKWTLQGDATVLADPAIFSVIENLVSNSQRHGGSDEIHFKVMESEGRAYLDVADNGKGIPDGIKSQLFNEGFTHGVAANTGLGLYLASMVMLRYGGSITVSDNLPQGAVFHLDFKTAQVP